MSDLLRASLSNKSTDLPPLRKRKVNNISKKNCNASYQPELWQKYFDKKMDIVVENDIFRVYTKGNEELTILFLHGGGFSSLTWSILCNEIVNQLHCTCIAYDCRGHGDSKFFDEKDLSADTLSNDVIRLINALFAENNPPLILVGHSMGGAIAVRCAASGSISNLQGLCVIDVVEGSALDALSSMQQILCNRPKHFSSLDGAIEWYLRSGQTRNNSAARVAFPGQLKRTHTGETAVNELECGVAVLRETYKVIAPVVFSELDEEAEVNSDVVTFEATSSIPFALPVSPPCQRDTYTWRVDLALSERYWRGWFTGMSQLFLSVPAAKLLLLAGTDRLDKELIVAQMQGRFQLQMLTNCGHVIHEDQPERVAEVLISFLVRNKFASPRDGYVKPSSLTCC